MAKPTTINVQTSHPRAAGLIAAFGFNGTPGAQVSESNLVGVGNATPSVPASCLYRLGTEGPEADLQLSSLRWYQWNGNGWLGSLSADVDWTLYFWLDIVSTTGACVQSAGNGIDNVFTVFENFHQEWFPWFLSDFGGSTIVGSGLGGAVQIHLRNNAALNQFEVFYGGVSQGVSNYSTPASTPSGSPINIYLPEFNAAQNQRVRDIRAWSRALSNTEIAQEIALPWELYTAPSGHVVSLGVIDQSPSIQASTLGAEGEAPAPLAVINQAPSLQTFGINPAEIQLALALITQTPALQTISASNLTPGVHLVALAAIDQSPALQALGVSPAAVQVALGLINQTAAPQTLGVALGAVQLSLGTINQAPGLQTFGIGAEGEAQLSLATINQLPALPALAAGAEGEAQLSLGVINQVPAVATPGVSLGIVLVSASVIDASPTLATIAASNLLPGEQIVALAVINQTPGLQTLGLAPGAIQIALGAIGQVPNLASWNVSGEGEVQLSLGVIDQAATLQAFGLSPAEVQLALAAIDQTPALATFGLGVEGEAPVVIAPISQQPSLATFGFGVEGEALALLTLIDGQPVVRSISIPSVASPLASTITPILIHPVAISVLPIDSAATTFDPDTGEVIGRQSTKTQLVINGQLGQDRNESLANDGPGPVSKARGYVLFRKVDLDTAGYQIGIGDKFTSFGGQTVDVWVDELKPMGHYPGTPGGWTLIRAYYSDRRPAR